MNDGLADVIEGLRRFDLWSLLAWRDVKRANVRTRIGVFWNPVTFYVVGLGMGGLYAQILGQTTERYVPYIAAGLLAWNFISAPFSEGLGVLVRDRGTITQVRTPLTLYVFRFVCKDALTLGLNSLGYFLVLLSFAIVPTPDLLALLPALALYLLTASAATVILSIASVFYPWLPSLLPSLMRLAFFVTPVLWMPHMIMGSHDVSASSEVVGRSVHVATVLLNPLYHYLEVFRGPLVGYHVAPLSWAVAAGLATVLSVVAVIVLSCTKTKVLVNL
jgi:ABC-2 type transport system permease protein